MKRYIAVSIIFHALFLIALFFFIPQESEKSRQPVSAMLVSPEEYRKAEELRRFRQKEVADGQRHDDRTDVLVTDENVSPSEISALPSSPKAPKKPIQTPAQRRDREQRQRSAMVRSPSVRRGTESQTGDTGDSPASPAGSRGRDRDTAKAPLVGPGRNPAEKKLFDREIIGKLARKDQPGGQGTNPITFDSREFRHYGYLQRLKEKIERLWKYPPEAARSNIYGDLYIQFTIKKDGKLGAVELTRTSGYRILDDAAMQSLRDSEPFWPLPDNLDQDSITISGHFIYTPHSYYVR